MSSQLLFVRHGATALNTAGLRCGGDLDVPLTDEGREQAVAAAQRLAGAIGIIVTSALLRTRETARIIAAHLDGIEVVVRPDFCERRLGAWNGLSIEATETALHARQTPPGGESDHDFTQRIADSARGLIDYLPRRPLLVGSRGVARVLGELLGQPATNIGNAEVATFDLRALFPHSIEGCTS